MSSSRKSHLLHCFIAKTSEPPIQGYVDPNFPNPDGDMDTPIIIYGYTPSIILAVVAALWFFLFVIVHMFLTVRYRAWLFVPFSIGVCLEVIGYIARCLSSKKDPYNLIYYIINYFFIVTAPVIMSAAIYTVLYVMITRLGRQYSLLPPKVVLWFFITSDVVSTCCQIAGAALVGRMSAKRQDPKPAEDTLLAGLAYQVFAMTVFIIVAGAFTYSARAAIRVAKLTTFVGAFGLCTFFIYLRTVFRLAETGQGLWGSLQTHEVYFALLEFLPIASAVPLFAIWHPGRLLVDAEPGSVSKV